MKKLMLTLGLLVAAVPVASVEATATSRSSNVATTAAAHSNAVEQPRYNRYRNREVRREVRRERRECRRELRRAETRRQYYRELRECQRELARAQRSGRWQNWDRRWRRW
jgi:hypothetical protein